MKNVFPDIFNYLDFRLYLNDYYAAKKSADKSFTHTFICRHLGQENAKSYFNNVVKGRVAISATFIDRFISLLELTPPQAKFFRALVNYNQTDSIHEKEFFFDQLIRLNKTPCATISKEAYVFYREWYHGAIRALLDIIDISDDYKLVATSLLPPISEKKALESIQMLINLELIGKNELGYWKPTQKMISTGSLARDEIVRRFQLKCLDQAKIALADERINAKRNITMTISVSGKARDQIMERIAQWKSELRSIIQKDDHPPSSVYHLNLNFFPMSVEETSCES
jgi:uncharacterized protein (TIGR02147 family)